jgi:hypothetical protein
MRRLFVAIALVAAAFGVHGAAAGTNDECVTVSVTAPVLGARTKTVCSPPTPYTGTLSGGNCQGVPPAHTDLCVAFTLHLP